MNDERMNIVRQALVLLAQCRTASLATVDAYGQPHAANIQYVHDDRLCIYFVSSPEAEHSRHIAERPDVAITVYHPDDADPQNIRGLQLHARAEAVTDSVERGRAMALYTARFPFIATDPGLRAAVEKQNFYKLTPTWLRLIDNRRGFGWKAEVDVSH